MGWLFFNWPPILFPIFAGLLLLASAAMLKPLRRVSLVPSLWLAVALTSVLGFVHCGTYDFAILQVAHFFGLAAFAFLVFQLFEARRDVALPLIGAAFAASMLSALDGYHQYFVGFEETRNYVYEQAQATGLKINEELSTRLGFNQVFSFFSISNSFAAHLILTLPVCVWAAAVFLWGALPSRALAITGASVTGCFLAGALALTQSRAAFVSFACSCGGAILLLFFKRLFAGVRTRRIKVLLGTAAVIVCSVVIAAAVFFVIVKTQKGTGSFSARADYYQVAVRLMAESPLTGAGWGDFFHSYCTMKRFEGEESPHNAHNFPLMMGSETGLFGFLCSLALLLATAALLAVKFWRSRDDGILRECLPLSVFAGWCAWSLHNLLDVDIQIPATCATAIVLVAAALLDGKDENDTPPSWMPRFLYGRAALACLALTAMALPLWRLPAEAVFQRLNDLCRPRPVVGAGAGVEAGAWEVKDVLAECSRRAPYSPFPWATAGTWAQRQGSWSLAEEFYKEAIKRSPERASYYYHLGLSQAFQGTDRAADARASFAEAARLFPFAYGQQALREKLIKKGMPPL